MIGCYVAILLCASNSLFDIRLISDMPSSIEFFTELVIIWWVCDSQKELVSPLFRKSMAISNKVRMHVWVDINSEPVFSGASEHLKYNILQVMALVIKTVEFQQTFFKPKREPALVVVGLRSRKHPSQILSLSQSKIPLWLMLINRGYSKREVDGIAAVEAFRLMHQLHVLGLALWAFAQVSIIRVWEPVIEHDIDNRNAPHDTP